MGKYIVTMRDIKKYEVLEQLINKKIKRCEAAILLGYSEVHISRLKQKFIKDGFKGLLRAKRESPYKTPSSSKEKIAQLYKNTYYDLNRMHFKAQLDENHNIKLSYETTRKILIE